jgi:hypothetical protein
MLKSLEKHFWFFFAFVVGGATKVTILAWSRAHGQRYAAGHVVGIGQHAQSQSRRMRSTTGCILRSVFGGKVHHEDDKEHEGGALSTCGEKERAT